VARAGASRILIRGSAGPGHKIEGNPAREEAGQAVRAARRLRERGTLARKDPAAPACGSESVSLSGGFGETADRLGFVVVDVEDRIEFSNLQQVMNLFSKVEEF
jgi:hypothetical protein